MPQCLIPNCHNNGTNNISIRLRRADTTAIWAPNSEAFLCDVHAAEGYIINIDFVHTSGHSITTNVSAGGHTESRTTPIVNVP
jgi:hypothetical protein